MQHKSKYFLENEQDDEHLRVYSFLVVFQLIVVKISEWTARREWRDRRDGRSRSDWQLLCYEVMLVRWTDARLYQRKMACIDHVLSLWLVCSLQSDSEICSRIAVARIVCLSIADVWSQRTMQLSDYDKLQWNGSAYGLRKVSWHLFTDLALSRAANVICVVTTGADTWARAWPDVVANPSKRRRDNKRRTLHAHQTANKNCQIWSLLSAGVPHAANYVDYATCAPIQWFYSITWLNQFALSTNKTSAWVVRFRYVTSNCLRVRSMGGSKPCDKIVTPPPHVNQKPLNISSKQSNQHQKAQRILIISIHHFHPSHKVPPGI